MRFCMGFLGPNANSGIVLDQITVAPFKIIYNSSVNLNLTLCPDKVLLNNPVHHNAIMRSELKAKVRRHNYIAVLSQHNITRPAMDKGNVTK